MLPFLKPKNLASVILAKRKPEGGMDIGGEEGEEDAGLSSAAEELISAIHSKDSAAVATALRNAFEILESEPHEEKSEEMDEGEA